MNVSAYFLGGNIMAISESVLIALFLIIIVFAALICLYGCVRLFSVIINTIVKGKGKTNVH